MKPIAAALFVASIAVRAAAAQGGETIAVLEMRSHNHPIAAAELTDRVREAVRRALPESRIVDRQGDADLVVSGRVSHGGLGYRAWLELRDREGAVLQRASANAGSRRELLEAIDAAATDLLRSRQEAAAAAPLVIGALQLPEVPAPAEAADDALNLEADTSVLVAWDRARRVEARGRENPDDAAEAWRRLAGLPGRNPFREIAATRAQQWEAFAVGQRASEIQLARDTTRLRMVLPLASVTDAAKVELLVRYATAYGFDRVSPLVALLPAAALRELAELSLDCEVKEAHACVQLARAADKAKDPKAALEFLDRACGAGAADSCAEAGGRWLQEDTRDPARAIAALQHGCEAANAVACVRLARVYEEGDGAAANAATAADLRDKACSAGDGKSCRRLAGISDKPARIADLLRKGCDGGDSVSCALAAREPAIVQRQLQEAAAGARKTLPAATPASAVEKPAVKTPPPSQPRTESETRDHVAAGGAMVVFGALAGAGAVILTTSGNDDHSGFTRSGRNVVYGGQAPSSGLRTVLTIGMGSAAILSTGVGLAMLFSRPAKPETSKVELGVSPVGVVVSGNFR
ncbi:MAG: tetratricopeptide repeat protein [Myxococcales bacterium]